MKISGKVRIISGVGIPPLGTFEETVENVSKVLGVNLHRNETDEFEPFPAYSEVVMGLTVVLLDPSPGTINKMHYELQVYGGSYDVDKNWVDISEHLIDLLENSLDITCRKL